MGRNSKTEAALTRAAIVGLTVDTASVEGLHSVTIGRLATELGLSKGGVIGPFGSKQALQLAAVDAASEQFRREVWDPVAIQPRGLTRLRAVVDAWFSYLERDVFPGGCFLTAAALEFDGRPGAVRDAITATWSRWLDVLEHEARTAQRQDELGHELSPRQLAFELNAAVMAGNWAKQLFGGPDALAPSRATAARLLAGAGAMVQSPAK